MTVDREQVRRDDRTRKIIHVLFNCECRHEQTGYEAMRELDALLAELKQAERERDGKQERIEKLAAMLKVSDGGRYMNDWIERGRTLLKAEAQLVAVPALVEALRTLAKPPHTAWPRTIASDALSKWEQAQGEKL